MASQGPLSPALAVSIMRAAPSEIPWIAPGHATAEDANFAVYVSTPAELDEVSEYLQATTYGFTIPDGSVIDGIEVELKRKEIGGYIATNSARIVKGGTVVGTDHGNIGVEWPTPTEAYATYGSPTDKWGTTFTPAEIRADGFGAAFQAIQETGVGEQGDVDHIRITVYYTPGPPTGLPVVWSVQGDGVVEEYGYKTDVLMAYDGTEQRVKLRAVPEEAIRFAFRTFTAREAEIAAALAFGSQDDLISVPLWQYGSTTTSSVAPGATLIPIADALSAPYVVGEFAVLWVDAVTWEQVKIASVTGAGLGIVGGLGGAWPARSRVYPSRKAQLADRVSFRWASSRYLEGEVQFRMNRR